MILIYVHNQRATKTEMIRRLKFETNLLQMKKLHNVDRHSLKLNNIRLVGFLFELKLFKLHLSSFIFIRFYIDEE